MKLLRWMFAKVVYACTFVKRCKRSRCVGFTCSKGFMALRKVSLCSSAAPNVVKECSARLRIALTRAIWWSWILKSRQKTRSSTTSTEPFLSYVASPVFSDSCEVSETFISPESVSTLQKYEAEHSFVCPDGVRCLFFLACPPHPWSVEDLFNTGT